jgi:outer membrane immunogenic protein
MARSGLGLGAAKASQVHPNPRNSTRFLPTCGFLRTDSATIGAGLEYGFAPNWSVAVEYDHIFEDKHDVVFTLAGTALTGRTTGGDTDLVTARVNYRWGAPVVAKY